MAVTFADPGSSATFGLQQWTDLDGATSSSTQTFDGAPRSIRLLENAGFASAATPNAIIANAGGRVVFWVYIPTMTTVTDAYLAIGRTASGAADNWSLRMNTAGNIGLKFNDGTITYGSTVLTTGAWHRIAVAWTWTSTTVNQGRLWVDGVLQVTLSNVTTVSWALSTLYFLLYNIQTGFDAFYSSIYIDDSTALTDPGNVRVTAKRPTSNGTAVEFTTQIGSGGSGYGSGHTPQVNERALSATNGWSISTTTRKTEEYNIEAAGTGDTNITGATILGVIGWAWANVDSTANSPVHRLILNNTTYAITLTTSAALYRAIGTASYPAGSGTDIGIDAQYTTTAHLTRLFECGVMICYIPSTGGLSIPVAMHHRRQQGIA